MGNVYLLYGFFDGDVMVYVGVTKNFHGRLWLHRRDAERRRYPIYQLWMQRIDEGAPLEFRALQEFDDRPSALRAERDMIAAIGIVEDGGTLLNRRRSSIGPAGYVEEALKLMSEASKRAHLNPEYARQMRERVQRMAADPAYRASQSAKLKAAWSDPEYRERAVAIQHSDEVQAKRAARMKRLWADPVFREKMAKRRPKTWTDEGRAAQRAMMLGNKFARRKED